MTLTDKWRKGELEEGFYYVTDGAELTIDYYLCDYWERHFDSDIQEVLAPVPSYDHFVELTEKVKENQQLRKWCEEFNALDVAEENKKLKELLKECGQKFFEAERNYGFDDSIVDICSPMIDKITNAIGEK